MKAAVLTGVRKMELRDLPEPVMQREDDVLLAVDVVGVCGSDMHYYRTGRIGQQIVKFPWLVGHEAAGTVLKLSPKARGLAVGDRVHIDPLIPCNRCDQCLGGRRHTCRNQKFLGVPDQLNGCLCERIVMPAECCFKVPSSMTQEQATMVEPFAIGLYAARRAGKVSDWDGAILGSGPIGLCVLLALKTAGPCRIFSTDLLDERVAMARRCGAAWAGNASKGDMEAEILKQCPHGVDFVWEAAGQQETLDQALHILKPGGTLLIVGIPHGDRISLDMNYLRRREITVLNIRRQNECVQPAIDLIAAGKVNVDPLVTHRFKLEQTQQAFDMVADYKDGAIKAMIHLT